MITFLKEFLATLWTVLWKNVDLILWGKRNLVIFVPKTKGGRPELSETSGRKKTVSVRIIYEEYGFIYPTQTGVKDFIICFSYQNTFSRHLEIQKFNGSLGKWCGVAKAGVPGVQLHTNFLVGYKANPVYSKDLVLMYPHLYFQTFHRPYTLITLLAIATY